MARAKRHYIPGYVWHITQRCHKREFLLKFSKDRRRWMHWLYEAKKRYGLIILNYMITSNHIHLLVKDSGQREVIPRSLQLVAGRAGQEYNQRKQRVGAFWQDRYHAVAVESGSHFRKCLVYMDMNMVRAGVVSHPYEWPDSGYKEIQQPRRKYVLIDYNELMRLAGYSDYKPFQEAHHGWIETEVNGTDSERQSQWTESIAVGSKDFVNKIKCDLCFKNRGRKVRETSGGFELREPLLAYNPVYEVKK